MCFGLYKQGLKPKRKGLPPHRHVACGQNSHGCPHSKARTPAVCHEKCPCHRTTVGVLRRKSSHVALSVDFIRRQGRQQVVRTVIGAGAMFSAAAFAGGLHDRTVYRHTWTSRG